MVILFFDDGHAEPAVDEVLQTEFAQTDEIQVITLLTPEEEFTYGLMGLLPNQQGEASPFTEAR